ncbi:MAG: choice-of-anchor D domain-containing protein, partial [Candidatus Cloacimonadaceae bacterium]|nr:choice-of-anchor D domain-containing protein [Candidatus Cloacimonadaceae bacterium]
TPTLWGYTQSGIAVNRLVQFDVTTGAVLQSYDLANAGINLGASSSGGLSISTSAVPGYATLIGNIQNVSFWGLELCTTANWAVPSPRTGTVPAGQSVQIEVTFDGISNPPGEYLGHFAINNNATDPVFVALDFTVEGEWLPIFAINPTEWAYGDVEQLNPAVKQFTVSNPGGGEFSLEAGSITISGDAEGNFVVNAPGLPLTLSHGQTYNFTVTFTPQTVGAKTATLNIQDGMRVNHTVALSGSGIPEPIGRIVNLNATVLGNENVRLNWGLLYGEEGEPGWLRYDDGVNADGIGTGAAANFNVAIKFPTTIIGPYAGMNITNVKFYPKSANTNYTVRIWTGLDGSLAPATLVYEQAVVAPVIDAWNDILLNTPVNVSGLNAVWIGYNCDVLNVAP